MSEVNKLSKEKIEECRTIFNLNDINHNGFVPARRLVSIFRSLGAYVPQEDLNNILGNRKEIKYEKFINIFAEYYTKKIEKQQIIIGLSYLDRNKDGMINASELKHALTSIGERLSEEEAYDLLKSYTDKSGNIDYQKFAGEISKYHKPRKKHLKIMLLNNKLIEF